jgi:hypothetical protein
MTAVSLRTHHRSALRADVAAELRRLETQAAVLERDLRKRRALLIEQGLDISFKQSRKIDPASEIARVAHRMLDHVRAANAAARRFVRRVTPHVVLAFRIAKRCVIEGALSCAIAAGSLAATALAIIALAPPE